MNAPAPRRRRGARSSPAPSCSSRRSAFKPYGIFILSTWAVMTIAAIGLNLTLGYAGQISLAQAAFVGIGAYVTALPDDQGWPFWRPT